MFAVSEFCRVENMLDHSHGVVVNEVRIKFPQGVLEKDPTYT
jgi:hypothetical protein